MGYKIQIKCKERDGDKWFFVRPSYDDDYEYDTYEKANSMIDIIMHAGWDRDKYRVFPNFTEQEKDDKWFDKMSVPNDCDECPSLVTMRDALSTGDSPTEYECGEDCRKACSNWSDDSWLLK